MKIVFVSNYYNHHQDPFSKALFKYTGGNYYFIQTVEMSEERRKLGYGRITIPSYVLKSYENEKKCQMLIDDADIVISGSFPEDVNSLPEKMIKNRIKNGKVVFRACERPIKRRLKFYQYFHLLLFMHLGIPRNSQIYLLSTSAYAASDYKKFGMFRGRAYKWGYFPEVKKYDDNDDVIAAKRPASILWVGRLIGWKHPGASIEVAKRLKQFGYTFELNLIGCGELEDELRKMIAENGLGDCVHMLGAMPPEKVRENMEQSEIFLFTSDRNEGWGAVLNESMNSGCAVVASNAIGSVPYLLESGKNGVIYEDGDIEDLTEKVKFLFDNPKERKRYGRQAYLTMVEQWNAENAAKRFMILAKAILEGTKKPILFETGVCSKA